ncbi:MarR family winged helix-turn-helix transcriptional regulator [Piscinibacter sakaiensis]|uniref:MarR family winged helix-turn-helix transcriptional regulator n=1 Tax=Piscinibacter sakaiensis TaxID=1547922 RepID=UPI003AAE331B
MPKPAMQSVRVADIEPAAQPAAFIDDYLAYLLARTSHLISAEFHAVVQRARLPVLQWRVLATLADGSARTIGEVATMVLIPQSTLTRIAERMVQAGLLQRAADSSDRRFTRIRLTDDGLALADRLVQQAREHEAAVVDALGADDARALKRILHKLIEQHAEGGPANPR